MTHPALVQTLLQPGFYPHRPARVDLVQTHISFLFLAGEEVYKVKKPVDFGFLDFTTLEKRQFYCNEEVRLNRRLAPEVYLSVAPIHASPGKTLTLAPEGPVVEYAVRMRRLPQDRMLKALLSRGEAPPAVMEAIAARLARFHREAATGGAIDEMGSIDVIRRNHEENFVQTRPYVGETLSPLQHRFLETYSENFLRTHASLFPQRVNEQRIRECHGDLHMEHICLSPEITIFDCIEFNERFRCGDVAAEVAFLAMDLDFHGFPAEADVFVQAYVRHSGDRDLPVLLPFYQCYYAVVRGKVVGFRLGDAAIGDAAKAQARAMAESYFALALRYAARPERPVLIAMAGLTGTGKSVFARALGSLLGAEILQMDVLRKTLLGLAPAARRPEPFGQGIYGEETTDKTYAHALEKAADALDNGRSVILDGSFRRRQHRLQAAALAQQRGGAFFLVECVCPEPVIRERLAARQAAADEPSDGRWEIYEAQRRAFEPVKELAPPAHLRLDTDGSATEAALRAAARIRFGVSL